MPLCPIGEQGILMETANQDHHSFPTGLPEINTKSLSVEILCGQTFLLKIMPAENLLGDTFWSEFCCDPRYSGFEHSITGA